MSFTIFTKVEIHRKENLARLFAGDQVIDLPLNTVSLTYDVYKQTYRLESMPFVINDVIMVN